MKNNLRKTREKQNISISQLAKTTGLNSTTIWRIEKNIIIPKVNTAKIIAQQLNVNVDDLFELTEPAK